MEVKVVKRPQADRQRLEGKDLLFGTANVSLAFLLIRMVIHGTNGLAITLATLIFCGFVLGYIKAKQLVPSKVQYFYLAYVLLLGGSFTFLENQILLRANLLFLWFSCLYWVLTLVGARQNDRLDQHFFSDLLRGMFVKPFKNLRQQWSGLSSLKGDRQNAKYILLGTAVSLPVLVLVLSLLASAEGAFQYFLQEFSQTIANNFGEHLLTLLLAIPLGSYFFLVVYKNLTVKMTAQRRLLIRTGPNVLFMTILVIFIVAYLLFFAAAVYGYLEFRREAFSSGAVSRYARQGFFQLLKVALINVLIFAGIKSFSQQTLSIKLGLTVIGLETLGLVWLGLAKMQLYIQSFGLTILRFNTSWFMVVLFVCVLIFIAALWKNFNYTKVAVLFMAGCILGLSYRNTGNDVTAYNYQQYQTGQLSDFDADIFYLIGPEAVPTAIEVYQTGEPVLREAAAQYLETTAAQITTESVITWQRTQALKAIQAIQP